MRLSGTITSQYGVSGLDALRVARVVDYGLLQMTEPSRYVLSFPFMSHPLTHPQMWSLYPPFDLLCTFVLPVTCTPTTLAVDPSERFFYVGTTQGDVYHFPLFRKRAVLGDHDQSAAAAAASQDEWEAVGGDGNASAPIKPQGAVISLKDANDSITSLALSLSSTHLLVGTSAGNIQIHSLPSHQHLRTLSPHAGPVTHLTTLLRPADLVGSVGVGAGAGAKGEEIPIMEIKPLERLKGRPPQESHEPTVLLRPPTSHAASLLSDLRPPPAPAVTRRQAMGDAGTTSDQVGQLLAENKRLKAAFERAEKINEKLWNKVMDVNPGTNA